MTISDKVITNLEKRPYGQGKKWLASQLGLSRPTLKKRLYTDYWTDKELSRLKELGIIN